MPAKGVETSHLLTGEELLARFTALHALYDELHGDLVGAYAQLQDAGVVEIITSCATHAYLPVLHEPAARRGRSCSRWRGSPCWRTSAPTTSNARSPAVGRREHGSANGCAPGCGAMSVAAGTANRLQ